MKQNLDTLAAEIEKYLEQSGFVVFHAYSRAIDASMVNWEIEQRPEYQGFLEVAKRLKVPLIVFHQGRFSAVLIDRALEDLEVADLMSRDDRRVIERRLRELRMYEGFTWSIELSFDYASKVYFFELYTDWHEEVHQLLDDIAAATPDDEEDDKGGSMGGYYSRN